MKGRGVPASRAFTKEYAERVLLAVKKYVSLIEKTLKDAKVVE